MWKLLLVTVTMWAGVAEAKEPPDVVAIKKLVTAETNSMTTAGSDSGAGVYTDAALIATPTHQPSKSSDSAVWELLNTTYVMEVKPSGVRVGLARDGQSAWVTYAVTTEVSCDSCTSTPGPDLRASELVVKIGGTWRVHAALWSEGVADKKVNKAGKAGTLKPLDKIVDSDAGDASVRDAFAALVTKGFDPALAASKDLVAIGTAPKEMTVGGKALVPFVNKTWVGKMAIKGPVLAVTAPSGTTAAVWANVNLTKTDGKTSYSVPFRWFVVFDKDPAGTWTPAHIHFSVAPPP